MMIDVEQMLLDGASFDAVLAAARDNAKLVGEILEGAEEPQRTGTVVP